ncbi:MAG: 2-oxoacid:acceptor oxidoreductase family protein [Limnochordia bacterium]|jgi:indolepyruvate ferredoxin oxidoreductase alpha subunit
MDDAQRLLLSGNEAVALAASHCGVALGTGYPGTPSTEILENFSLLGGHAQWAPNEKVAAEVGLGAAYANARVLVTMKHVGLNVAADCLFTMAYTGVTGGYVLVSADDPGMASSQNEQDTRRYAEAAGVPLFEPSDAQEAYDLLWSAYDISERFQLPVIFRMTTRVCHTKSPVVPKKERRRPNEPRFERSIQERVMIPAHAKPAHRRLRRKLADLQAWNEAEGPNMVVDGDRKLGIISAGVSFLHSKEAAPQARFLKLGMAYPLPVKTILDFIDSVDECLVVEENDPWLVNAIRAVGGQVKGKDDSVFRFGELNADRVKRIVAGDSSPETAPAGGKPPQLCPGCPHRATFGILKQLDCIVAGDIGCYTLAALPPFEAMDTMIDMGAAIGVGLGLRHVLPPEQAKRVVSVIGDSTFVHSGITGLAEMVYNPPPTGHVVIILDNDTTAMTGLQEHPGTGHRLDGSPSTRLSYEELAKAMGIANVHVLSPVKEAEAFEAAVAEALASDSLTLIVARQPCVLASRKRARGQTTTARYPAETSTLSADSPPPAAVTNVRFAGLGGMGVVTASDILADVAFCSGYDVKKADVHGMSQRGGSVSSDVRFGSEVHSPMIPANECDLIVIMCEEEEALHAPQLREGGLMITPQDIDLSQLKNKRALNVALLGVLSRYADFEVDTWLSVLRRRFPEKLYEANEEAFLLGRGGCTQ